MATDDQSGSDPSSINYEIIPAGGENYDAFVRNLMDDIERRVEKLREQALSMEQEKEAILATLQKIQDNQLNLEMSHGDQEELEANADRLICRCLTVDISVLTPRNDNQEIALQKVRDILTNLKEDLSCGKAKALERAKSYLNACSSETDGKIIDHRFQGIILDCTADDQKMTRKKLKEIITNYNKFQEEKTDS